jgi:hypothetical protein
MHIQVIPHIANHTAHLSFPPDSQNTVLPSMKAAHGFAAHHPWAASIGAFINLESGGPHGLDVMFQSTGDWTSEVRRRRPSPILLLSPHLPTLTTPNRSSLRQLLLVGRGTYNSRCFSC